MKTLRELNESLSDIVKDKDIISYMDTSLSDDVTIKVGDKIYKIEGFGNQATANIKNTSKEKIFVIDKDSLLKLDKKEFKRLLIEPNSGDFKGIISISGEDDKEITFNIPKDIDESIITEKGSSTDGISGVAGAGLTGALGFLIGGPLGAVVSASIFSILNPNTASTLFSGIAGLGIFKKLFNKEDNKNTKNGDDQSEKTTQEVDTSKTNIKTLCLLNMYAEDLGDPKISASINKLTDLAITSDGDINNEILQRELSKKENKNLIKQIENIAKKSDKEMIAFVGDSNKMSDTSANKYIEIIKTQKDYNDLEVKYNDKKETIASLKENIKVFKEQGDNDSVKNAEDKIKSLNKELESLEESLNSHSKKIENLENDIRKEVKSLAINKPPKTDNKDTKDTKDNSGEDDADMNGDDIKNDGEDDTDIDANDSDTDAEEVDNGDGTTKKVIKNPAKIWHRKKKKNGQGSTKNYYNSKGDSITASEFKDKMKTFNKRKSNNKKEVKEGKLRTLKELC